MELEVFIKNGYPESCKKAFEFTKAAHGKQARKYTGVPYTDHLEEVASKVAEYTTDIDTIKAALLHDTLEDTATTFAQIQRNFGIKIANIVLELTDYYTAERFPRLNRRRRKELECARRSWYSNEAKLIKAADHINNIQSIAQHDRQFARVYIPEIENSMYSIWMETPLHHKLKNIIEQIKIEVNQ